MQRIITLTTDFGYRDHYVGALKGKIYSNIIGCNLVDISHGIGKYNTEEAGFVIGAAYKQFPKGTIHIIAVDASITEYSKALCVKYDGHYFITSDNGIISVVLGNNDYDEAIFINHDGIMKSNDIFVYCAYQLHEGRALRDIGVFTDTIYVPNRLASNLVVGEDRISGKVIYEDSYGNLVTNITKECFESLEKGREYAVRFKDYRVNRVSHYFADFKNADWASLRDRAGELVVLFNDVDLLTIALFYSKPDSPGGTPRNLMNINLNDSIVIDFNQEEQN
ncbi:MULTISPECIES: S-adenosyl-l-methionine hydroxide adenosyltransferase family protein [Myroides]|uniref:SAM hydrolase/SAM-dependent halogenase family protein n=1 Tax=Myroides TaxID=76831 RepID=UPI001303416E|nr:SAM-dependent chlorinase/fluorinase [Myroides phaeus]